MAPTAPRAAAGPRVAAIIPTWRKAADSLDAIASLRAGTLPPAVTIVLDNGSGDGTLETLRAATSTMTDVEVIGLPENLGFAAAVNRGIARALDRGATHVLLMNDDAVVDARCVERLVAALEATPAAGIAAPRILYHGRPDRVWQGEGRYSRLRTGVVSPEKNRAAADCAPGRRAVTFATGCVLLIDRAVFDAVGPFEEALWFYEEDVELERRAARAGHGIVYEPEAMAYHKIEDIARGRATPFALYHLARSRLLRLRLAGRGELAWGMVMHLLAYTPFRLLQVIRGGGGFGAAAAWLRGTRDGLFHPLGHG